MVTAHDLHGDWVLVQVTACGKPVDDVEGQLCFHAEGPTSGIFQSSSRSEFGDQCERGSFSLVNDHLLATILESTAPSMVGIAFCLRIAFDGAVLVLHHVDPAGREGVLVQSYIRATQPGVEPAANA